MQNNLENSATGPTIGPGIVEQFRICGLYGYRTVEMNSPYAASIQIAKNGTGKTTLLGALDAFLKGQFGRLAELHFSHIECKLMGLESTLLLTKEDVLSTTVFADQPDFISVAKSLGLDPAELWDFMEYEYQVAPRKKNHDHDVYNKVFQKTGYSIKDTDKIFERINNTITRNPNVVFVRKKIREVLKDVEIVHLSTYRRIELPLADDGEEVKRYGKRKSAREKLGLSAKTLFNADIQFGLADISDRLAKLNEEILFNSNEGYREISANIINELLDGVLDAETQPTTDRPDKEALTLFFSRIKHQRYYGRYATPAIPDIDKIYSGEDLSKQSSKFLNYFLGKLNTVIKSTRGIELLVEEFINNCNKYLSSSDLSTSLDIERTGELLPANSDSKELKLEKRNLKVQVNSLVTGSEIPLDALSSGEKQMISLFAKLYLYPGDKIILIDEPELSLSIEWQRKILLDVIGAPTCKQVIAITHSPFVFDNSLDPYAREISLTVHRAIDRQNNDDEGEA